MSPLTTWPCIITVRLSTTLLGYYLETTWQAYPYSEIQKRAAETILGAWRAGERHPDQISKLCNQEGRAGSSALLTGFIHPRVG